jgi:HEAT repeat protein
MNPLGNDLDELSELTRRLDDLAGEHGETVADATQWFVDHPDVSRPALDAIVRAGRDDIVTRRAIRALAAFQDVRDVPSISALLHGRAPGLVWVAAGALAGHPTSAALDALVEAVGDDDSDTAEAATSALGVRADASARPSLEDAAQHGTESVRYRAVLSLGQLGARDSAEVLRDVRAHDPSPSVREAAAQALGSAAV